MQRVITIGSLGDMGATTTGTTATDSLPTAGILAGDTSTPGSSLFLENLPTVLVWGAGAVLIGYALTRYFAGSSGGRRRVSDHRRHARAHRRR